MLRAAWAELAGDDTVQVDGVRPRFRAEPQTADELAQTLRQAADDHLAVIPRGGGTQLDIGLPPARADVLLQTSQLNRVVEYEAADLTVTVEAGLRFSDLQALLAQRGQFLALDPPAEPGATIGGLIATNASGPLRFAYGTPRDVVIGTRVAHPDGSITHAGGRVVKNVAGYDLNKLYVGSLGTLGVLVELSFKLAPIPPATATVLASFDQLAPVRELLGALVRSPFSPLAIELLDAAAAADVGLPRSYVVALLVGGYPRAVERQVRDVSQLLGEHAGQRLEVSQTVWEELSAARLGWQRQAVVLKAAAPISLSLALVELLAAQLAAFEPRVWSHAGSGVAFAACAAPANDLSVLAAALTEARRRVRALGENASLVVQRCPTALKRIVDVWGEVREDLVLMRRIKAQLDPNGILNPGRSV